MEEETIRAIEWLVAATHDLVLIGMLKHPYRDLETVILPLFNPLVVKTNTTAILIGNSTTMRKTVDM